MTRAGTARVAMRVVAVLVAAWGEAAMVVVMVAVARAGTTAAVAALTTKSI